MRFDKVEKRHDEILKMLNSNDSVTNAQLCKALKCSESTIRNDLTLLEKEGYLLRTFGGAVKTKTTPYNLLDVNSRAAVYLKEKKEIAAYVVEHILEPHMTIILDAGTTCKAIAEEIAKRAFPLTVITNSIYVSLELLPVANVVNSYMLGGLFDKERGRFYDTYKPDSLERMRADIYFMAVNGINEDAGAMITGIDEMQTKQEFLKNAKKCVVVADHSKVGRSSLRTAASLEEIDTIIVDSLGSEEMLQQFRVKGVNAVKAEELK